MDRLAPMRHATRPAERQRESSPSKGASHEIRQEFDSRQPRLFAAPWWCYRFGRAQERAHKCFNLAEEAYGWHQEARPSHASRRRGGMADCGARAAIRDASDRLA